MSDFMIRNFYKQRKDFEKSSAERNLTLTFPDTVTEIKNIPYMTDASAAKNNTSLNTDCPPQSSKSHIRDSHRLDCYRPKKQDGELLPVIVNVHGGGLLLGSKEFNRLFCMRLSELGFLVYSVEYRLIPDCSFFDQCQDLACAMDFLKTRISSDNGDLSHVYAVGDSGGACLLTYTAALQHAPAAAKAAKVTPSSLHINALGLISGMFYTTKKDKIGLFLPKYLYGKNYKKSAFAPFVNPEHPDIIKALPPCFLVTSHNDYLKRYTLQFEKALARYQVPHDLLNFPKNPKLTHAFSVFEPELDESLQTMKSMIDFLQKY